jgi:hypothetical protein
VNPDNVRIGSEVRVSPIRQTLHKAVVVFMHMARRKCNVIFCNCICLILTWAPTDLRRNYPDLI